MSKRVLFLLVLLSLVLAACGGGGGGTASQPSGGAGDPTNGQKIFTAGKGSAPACASCHSIKAGEKLVGPSMAGIVAKGDQTVKDPNYKGKAKNGTEFVRESIVEPNTYVEQGYQPGVMYQNYGKDLTAQEINDVVAYLATLK